jgi:glutamyl-tRNA reductase
VKDETAAMEHLYHVAAGLDSQILGDFEILGQIKNSVKFSKERGRIGSLLERIINSVYQSAKAIKTHTELSGGTVSVSFAAVQFIKEHFGDVNNKKIILLGTGKIGKATCKNLVDYLQTRNITLLNRTEETATNLAQELQVQSAPFSELEQQLADADVVLVSTGAMEPVIWRHQLEGKGAKLIIDLSVPRNVDVTARELEGITLVDVDLLSKIKDETLARRQAEVPKAKHIIKEHIAEFMEWYKMRKYIPVLNEIKGKLRTIYITPILAQPGAVTLEKEQEETINKVMNTLAAKMRRKNTVGCHYIEAINDYIVING